MKERLEQWEMKRMTRKLLRVSCLRALTSLFKGSLGNEKSSNDLLTTFNFILEIEKVSPTTLYIFQDRIKFRKIS